MAILKNMWLRGASQKLGGVVLYTRAGETVARELAPAIQNPRTESQMSQRVRLANVVNFYKASASWMRGAFESKPAKQSDYNAFVSANLTASEVALTKSEAATGAAIVAPYRVTAGSLPSISWTSTDTSTPVSSLIVGNFDFGSATTVGQFASGLLANNNIPAGAQLSVIIFDQTVDGQGVPYINTRKYEVLLNAGNIQPLRNYIPETLLRVNEAETNNLGINLQGINGGFVMVLSHTTGSSLRVSTQNVILTPTNTLYTRYTSSSQRAEAIRSYGESTDVFLDSNAANYAPGSAASGPQITGMSIGGQTYAPGSEILYRFGDGEQITLNLSTPINVNAGATVNLSVQGINDSLTFEYNGANLQNVTSVTLTADEALDLTSQITSPLQMNVEFDPSSGSPSIFAYYLATGGLE